jgi:peptidoglycan pentaglycine glycine transferase (the first glycine)
MVSEREWDSFLASHPDAHLLQASAWGRLKSAFGWLPLRLIAGDAGAQVLLLPLRLGFHIAYLPRGPVPATPEALAALQPSLEALCRSRRAVFLRMEPDFADSESHREGLRSLGFLPSASTVQPPRTILVDLPGGEEDLLARMKPKTRYNIRLAARHGVVVRPSDDVGSFASMIRITGGRNAFPVHSDSYYRKAFAEFSATNQVLLLMAFFQEKPVAGLMAFAQGRRCWYLYGASADEHREVMAPYFLQWEAIRWARSRGCSEYDLWGIPDEEEPDLEQQFTAREDGLWGVYRFKRGFGGRIHRTVGTWDRVFIRPAYTLYRMWSGRRTGNQA